jgi:hypothetical protein
MRRVYRKRPIDYILPFLIILGIGVISVLGFQVWSAFEKQGKADAYFYVAEGRARLLPYGQTAWDNAYSGTKLLLGDSLKTLSMSRVVVAFFNGTLIRMDNDTAVTLSDLSKAADKEKIVMTLDNGSVWVNGRRSPDVKEGSYQVRTSHMLVKAIGTVFEVESGAQEIVRVMKGSVSVDIYVKGEGKERVATTIDVGVGQQLTLDDATLKVFEENQSPSVLMAISEDFKASAWYRWNTAEDENPSNYRAYGESAVGESQQTEVSGSTSETQGTQAQQSQQTSETSETSQAQSLTEEYSLTLEAPKITSPDAASRSVNTGPVTIAGTVAVGTDKVIVEQMIDGNLDSYTLGKFKAGDATFTYNVSEMLGNLKPGDNEYSFYAVNAKGQRSSGAKITINKKKVEITDALTSPKVLTFNGTASSQVTVDAVTVEGEVAGAEKVVVNGYALGKFEPGSKTWSYIAKVALGNLKPGVNDFEVYAVDPEGKKSEVVKFTITYAVTDAVVSPQPVGTQQTQTQYSGGF